MWNKQKQQTVSTLYNSNYGYRSNDNIVLRVIENNNFSVRPTQPVSDYAKYIV